MSDPAPVLVAASVVKRFGGLVAVDRVDLTVRAGEIVGLIGPNGAGKSTLFNLLAGALHPEAGRITAFGRDITRTPAHVVCRAGLARTFQIVRPLRGLTVLENVMVGALLRTNSVAEARRRSLAVAEQVGLAALAGVPAGNLTLSGRKRLEVARALATAPRLLLLDEVMAGLNPAELHAFLDVLWAVHASGVTLVLVEHVMEAVMSLCTRIVVMNQGAKIADGDPGAVIQDPRVIEAYVGGAYAAT